MQPFRSHPFDDDKLKEECGIFGVVGVADASNFVALGLHALQHRGQEAGGIVSYHPDQGFNSARRFGYVRDNFTKADVMDTLPGSLAIGHVRYSTAGSKGSTAIRDVQPFFGEFSMGGCAIAHNGNLTNASALRRELIERGSIFQSSSDSECIIHLMARSIQKTLSERIKDALRRVEGAFSIVAMTRTKLIGVRDALGVRLEDRVGLCLDRGPGRSSASVARALIPTGLIPFPMEWVGQVQEARVDLERLRDFLRQEINGLDKKLADIKNLKEKLQALLARKKAVESLQANRTAPVPVRTARTAPTDALTCFSPAPPARSTRAASATSTLALRRPKSNGSHATRTPTAVPHTLVMLFSGFGGP